MSSALGLRSLPAGGDPQAPSEDKLITLLAPRRILFLVHGYNNNEAVANEAFAAFEAIQRELAGVPPGQDYALGWEVVRVYWAGDADWSIVSPLFYMGAVTNAKKTGELLADVIARLGGQANAVGAAHGNLEEIAFVSHSLGCRVALEAVRQMEYRQCRARVVRVAFFAAAVPTFKLEEGGAESLTGVAQKITDEWLSLFSEHDSVLGATFPLGQTLARGDEGVLPTALGFALWASARTAEVLSQVENRGAGHGDYWGWNAKTRERNGRFAGYCARSSLRLEPVAQSREMQARFAVVRSTEAREIAAREQKARESSLYNSYL